MALSSHESWRTALFEASPDGMLVLDTAGRCVDANRALCEMLGASREELVGTLAEGLAVDAAGGSSFASLAGATTFRGEFSVRAGEGPVVTLDWQARAHVVPGLHLWIGRDVTRENVDGEHLLAAQRLAAIVESSDDAIVSKDLTGVITSWNAGAERVFGYSAEEMVGRSIAVLVPENRPDEEASILRRLRAGDRIDHYETVRVRKDGMPIDVSVTISPIRDADGRVVGASKVARDITHEKALRTELERRVEELAASDRRKDEFLAMLAHELRNPMGAISNAVHLLEQTDDAAIRSRAQQVLRRQVQHQARIVNELLDVSRISRGLIELHFEELDAAGLLRDAVEDYRAAMERERISISLHTSGGPLWVRADRTRLAQVVTNLLTNALKFTKPGGRVSVSAQRSADRSHIEIAVEDTGIGIDPELLPHVFESFSHGDRSLARTQGGLGLGLAIVKGLVDLHEGEVEVHSDGPGHGTAVRIKLPARVKQADLAWCADNVGHGCPLRILVIEDNRDAAEMLADLLALQGHQVDVALDGAEGVRMAREGHPDLVLCDLGLPGMDGFEVAAALRIAPGGARQRLVAVTGYGQEEDRRRSREAGFHDHLVKPIGADELRRVLTSVVDGLKN